MRNEISIYGYSVSAYVEIFSISGTVPIGYMGCKARCLNDAGVLVAESSWAYNSSPLIGMGGNAPLTGTYNESYYSDGITRVWNGTGYWTYGGVPSPKMTCEG